MTTKLDTQGIQEFLAEHPSWQLKQQTSQSVQKLHKVFEFKDFIQAFGFMSQCALIAERDNHHPDWSNVYKTVVVDLITHEYNAISERDLALATAMDNVAAQMQALA